MNALLRFVVVLIGIALWIAGISLAAQVEAQIGINPFGAIFVGSLAFVATRVGVSARIWTGAVFGVGMLVFLLIVGKYSLAPGFLVLLGVFVLAFSPVVVALPLVLTGAGVLVATGCLLGPYAMGELVVILASIGAVLIGIGLPAETFQPFQPELPMVHQHQYQHHFKSRRRISKRRSG